MMSSRAFWGLVGKKWSLVRSRDDKKSVKLRIKSMVARLERERQALPSLKEEILNLIDEDEDDEDEEY